MSYWVDRQLRAQTAIADKTIEDIQKQLAKYYKSAAKNVIKEFEATYDKLIATVADGKEPTPADLYKLDKYWEMESQLKEELQKLGDKEIELLSEEFDKEWKEIYNALALKGEGAYSTIATDTAKAMLNTSWLGDGRNFSQRIWGNTERLAETLNEQLVHCVVTGKKDSDLRKLLQERFNVSFNQANTLVRTEVAHIQTEAAAQRYQDYGLKYYEFLGREEHDIGCDCKKLDGKKFLYSEMKAGKNAPPMHPNCRCAIVPVVDEESEKEIMEKNENIWELTEKEKEQLERVYKEYPEVKAERDKREIQNKQRKQMYQDRVTEIDDILSGKKGIETYSLKQNLMVIKKVRNKTQYIISPDWRSKLQNHRKYAVEALERIEREDVYTLLDFIFCADCGKPIPVKGKKTNAVKRCPECQEKYRKKYKAQKERERRAKRKAK